MTVRKVFCAVVCCAMLTVLAVAANATSWTSFAAAEFDNIDIVQNGNTYTVTMNPGATVNGMAVDKIWGFYLVSQNQADTFTASGTNIPTTTGEDVWKWDTKQDNYAGWWLPDKKGAIEMGGDRDFDFTFDTLDLGTTSTVYGMHISYVSPTGGIATGSFKAVPEPSSVLAACSILGPVGFVFRRRRK